MVQLQVLELKMIRIYSVLIILLLSVLLGFPGYAKSFTVPPGSHAKYIAALLEKEGLVKSKWRFYLYVKSTGVDSKLRAGTFNLEPDYSYERIANILMEKEGAASLERVTFPEGYTLKEIAQLLEKQNIIKNAAAFEVYVNTRGKSDLKTQFAFLRNIPTSNLEGYLFPDTYVIARGVSHKKILAQFLKVFQKKALPIYQTSTRSLSFHNWVTLASIVEKESYVRSEMPIISGVFHNRLKKRMILASCPTVAYALNKPRKKFLTYSDLKVKSPYNTYTRQGLPPTPIASPGILALKATLKPAKTSYLYFVANGDGSHTFTKTLSAHLQRQKEINAANKLN